MMRRSLHDCTHGARGPPVNFARLHDQGARQLGDPQHPEWPTIVISLSSLTAAVLVPSFTIRLILSIRVPIDLSTGRPKSPHICCCGAMRRHSIWLSLFFATASRISFGALESR